MTISKKMKSFWREAYFIATKHNMSCMSAQLTYAVIVAIVPFFSVVFTFVHSRKNFETILDAIITPFIMNNFGKNVGTEIINYIRSVVIQAQITELSIISLVSFLVTVILLLLLIESIFNALLDSKIEKNYLVSFLKCWLLLVFSPFLFVLVTFRSDFLISVLNLTQNFFAREEAKIVVTVFGYISQVLFFTLLYYIMPSRMPKFFAAMFGATITTIVLEVIRYINIYLVKNALAADTHQLYGSVPLMAILFFVWLRLVLLMIMFGFVFSTAFERVVYKQKH